MRKKLKELGDWERHTFIGRFERVGYKKSYKYCQPTLLLTNIVLKETGELITDHLWLNYTKGFWNLGELLTGDQIQFNGRVTRYFKGYFGTSKTANYKIERPTQIKMANRVAGSRQLLPDITTKLGKQALVGYIMERERKFYEASNRPIDEYYTVRYSEWLEAQNMKMIDQAGDA